MEVGVVGFRIVLIIRKDRIENGICEKIENGMCEKD
jgi:hypothetical protein